MMSWLSKNAVTMINRLKLLSLELIVILIVFLSSAFIVFFLVREVFYKDTGQIDQYVFGFLDGYTTPATTSFMQSFTMLGSHYFLVPANLLIIGYSYFVRRNTWFAIKTFSVAASSLLLMFALKMLFNRSRPAEPLLEKVPGLSFPSGHAFMSFTFFGLLIYLVYKRVQNGYLKIFLVFFLFCITVMIGLSRIYLKVHYATDVMAGFALGTLWLILSLTALHFIEKNKTKLPAVQ